MIPDAIPTSASPAAHRSHALERRVLAIAASALLHIVLLLIGAGAAAIVAATSERQGFPSAPLLVMAVALVTAHVSLSAIGWARTGGSIHLRTALTALTVTGLWLVLIVLLDETRQSGIRSAAWAASLATQALLATALATAIEFFVDRHAAMTRSRFSISYLLLWTTLLSMVLAGVGAWAARSGWKMADVANWTYFAQLQTVGVIGGLLAAAIDASVRLTKSWPLRSLGCLAAVIAFGALSPVAFAALFGSHIGAQKADIVWLFTSQGLFLVVSLIPLELARSPAAIPRS